MIRQFQFISGFCIILTDRFLAGWPDPKKLGLLNSVENRARPPARYRVKNDVGGQIRHPTRPADW